MRLKLDGDKEPPCRLIKAAKVYDHEGLNPREAYEKVGDAFLEFCDDQKVNAGDFLVLQERNDFFQCVTFTLILSPGSGS